MEGLCPSQFFLRVIAKIVSNPTGALAPDMLLLLMKFSLRVYPHPRHKVKRARGCVCFDPTLFCFDPTLTEPLILIQVQQACVYDRTFSKLLFVNQLASPS